MTDIARPPSGRVPVVVAALWTIAVAALGGAFTELGPWYAGLRQPSWKPPDLAFGPAWTVIFTLTASAGVLAWRAMPSPAGRRRLLQLLALNSVLNVVWSLLFFTLHRPDWALLEVLPLWLSVFVLMKFVRPHSTRAASLLWPYLIWVAYAASINLGVVHLNGPFRG